MRSCCILTLSTRMRLLVNVIHGTAWIQIPISSQSDSPSEHAWSLSIDACKFVLFPTLIVSAIKRIPQWQKHVNLTCFWFLGVKEITEKRREEKKRKEKKRKEKKRKEKRREEKRREKRRKPTTLSSKNYFVGYNQRVQWVIIVIALIVQSSVHPNHSCMSWCEYPFSFVFCLVLCFFLLFREGIMTKRVAIANTRGYVERLLSVDFTWCYWTRETWTMACSCLLLPFFTFSRTTWYGEKRLNK